MSDLVTPFFKPEPGPTQAEGYAAVKARANGRCEANVAPDCTKRHEETHHKKGRRVPDAHHPDHLLAACKPCHDWIGAHPEPATALGLVESRTVLSHRIVVTVELEPQLYAGLHEGTDDAMRCLRDVVLEAVADG